MNSSKRKRNDNPHSTASSSSRSNAFTLDSTSNETKSKTRNNPKDSCNESLASGVRDQKRAKKINIPRDVHGSFSHSIFNLPYFDVNIYFHISLDLLKLDLKLNPSIRNACDTVIECIIKLRTMVYDSNPYQPLVIWRHQLFSLIEDRTLVEQALVLYLGH